MKDEMDTEPLHTVELLTKSNRSSIELESPRENSSCLESHEFTTVETAWENDHKNREVPEASVSTKYIILLTCGTFGLQNVWSLLLANGTPYLLSIGFSQSTTALIWMAGPLSGTFIQPFIGAISDQSTSKYGKRKPFIIAGIVGAVLSMLSMAIMRICAVKIYDSFANEFMSPNAVGNIARTLVIFWICVLNLSLQPIQVGLRALVIDGCPTHQQSQASAWSGRFTGLGSIATYLLDGYMIRRFSNEAFEVLCIITSLTLIITNLPCLFLIKEKRRGEGHAVKQTFRPSKLYRRLLRTARRMPLRLMRICIVQFASWLGWFPFLYYNTTYIAGLDHTDLQTKQNNPNTSGVQAYLFFAIVSFACSVLLPFLQPKLSSPSPSRTKPNPKLSPASLLQLLQRLRPTLPTLWILSQTLFTTIMFTTFFISSTTTGTVLISITGVSWALTQWVPLAIMSAEIAGMREANKVEGEGEGEDETGTLMSIFNVAISAPQIFAGALCSGLFWIVAIVEDGEGDPLGWALRLGGVASLLAVVLMVRMS